MAEDVKIVIRTERVPGQHKGTVNAPSANEVAVLLTDADAGKRDIVLQRRSSNPNDLTIIDSLNAKYDTLQYPIIKMDIMLTRKSKPKLRKKHQTQLSSFTSSI